MNVAANTEKHVEANCQTPQKHSPWNLRKCKIAKANGKFHTMTRVDLHDKTKVVRLNASFYCTAYALICKIFLMQCFPTSRPAHGKCLFYA